MPNRVMLAALLALAVAGGALYWWLGGGAPDGRAGASAAVAPGATAKTAEPAEPSRALRSDDAPASAAPDTVAPPAAPTREAARSDFERELADAVWIEGRVVFPADTPLDERARVVAKGRAFEHAPDGSSGHAVDVAADGSFRVAFSPKTRSGVLRLEATWLLLDEPVKVSLRDGAADLAPIVLEPRLGGVLRGAVVPPEGADPATLVGSTVRLFGHDVNDDGSWTTGLHRTFELGPDLAYEFLALPPEGTFDVECDPEIFVPAEIEDFLVEPGKETRFELVLGLGAAVFGRVTDEAGEPVERASVAVDVAGDSGWSDANHRVKLSEADGTFRIAGLAAGAATLSVGSKGLEDAEIELGSLRAGDEVDAGTIALGLGRTIAGVVRWPDGTPAAEARVRAEQGADPWANNENVRSDEQGRFEITGLAAGRYRIDASAVKKSRITVTSRITGKERERTVSTSLKATALDVEVGTRGLDLVLSEGLRLAGRVVDDAGYPIPRFKLTYGRRVVSGNSVSVMYDGRRVVKDDDGSFELEGLEPGGLSLKVSADGYLQEVELTFELPREDGGERIEDVVLVRAARLAGVVLLPNGQPAGGARLEITLEREFEGLDLGASRTRYGDGRMTVEVPVGSDGAFNLESFPPAPARIVARRNGAMPSEPLTVELAPGETREGVVLRLSSGVRLTGVVLGPDGKAAPRRVVSLAPKQEGFEELHSLPGSGDQTTQSAPDGAFEFAGLSPGPYEIVAEPTPAELERLGFAGLAGAAEALASRADVEVTEAGAHVVVAPPPTRAVRVFGVVRVNGETAPVKLSFWHQDLDYFETTRASSDGEFAALLPTAGKYTANLEPALDGAAQTQVEFEVPNAAEHRRDFDLVIGGLSGRVLGPEGPVSGAPVTAVRALDEHGGDAEGWANVDADDDGRFAFDGLAAGTWTLAAGGPRNQGWGATGHRMRYLGEASAEDVRIGPGEAVTGVELRVPAAGAIVGLVRAADGPPARARLSLRAAGGELVPLFEQTRPNGEFELGGLPPGSYLLTAIGDGEVTAGETAVDVRAGRDTSVALDLAAGTLVRVYVTDAADEPLDAHVRCRRTDGLDVTHWRRSFSRGEDGRITLGPLPPGDYVVSADAQGSKKTEQAISLDGEPEREVHIQLP